MTAWLGMCWSVKLLQKPASLCQEEPRMQEMRCWSCLMKSMQNRTLDVQFSCSVVSDSLWPYGLQHASLPVHYQLPELTQVMSIESVMPSNHLIPLSAPSPAFSRSQNQAVFSNESVLHIRWPKYWSFSFSISPSNEYSGLISFRIDRFDLLAVQGTL